MPSLTLYYREPTRDTSRECSRDLLLRAASLHTGEDASSFKLQPSEGGKPYFQSHPHLHFSVSHSGTLWACLFAEEPVGLDVQEKKADVSFKRLAPRWFHPDEASRVSCEEDFYRIWSRKEAFVKTLGIGIEGHFKSFDSTVTPCCLGEAVLHLQTFSLPDGLADRYEAAAAYSHDFSLSYIRMADQ